ncbi:hypothetical protein [Nonomuraea rubra]|uniref:hypothetical protein n=1 Tax=Nonomuraea rubra TaxID=46180 RepID=UPI0033EE7781
MLFDAVRAPSTPGSFLRAFTWGYVRQLDKVARQVLAALATHTPLLPGADVLADLVHAVGRAGGGRRPAARRQDRLRPWRHPW